MAEQLKYVVIRSIGRWDEAETELVRGYDREADAQAYCDAENAKAEAHCRKLLSVSIREAEAQVAAADAATLRDLDRVYHNGKDHDRWLAEDRDPRTPLRHLREEWGHPQLGFASYGQPTHYVDAVPFSTES